MNQLNQTKEFAQNAESSHGAETAPKAPARPAPPQAQASQDQASQDQANRPEPAQPAGPRPARLTPEDVRALHTGLLQGDHALARRRDLGDLYQRTVTMITTLDNGLKERHDARSDEDRALLVARLDGMERAINEVEGVLRIEMEPLLQAAVRDAVADRIPASRMRTRSTFGRRIAQLALILLALYLGAVFSEGIIAFVADASERLTGLIDQVRAVLSPDGGI